MTKQTELYNECTANIKLFYKYLVDWKLDLESDNTDILEKQMNIILRNVRMAYDFLEKQCNSEKYRVIGEFIETTNKINFKEYKTVLLNKEKK